MRSTAFLAMAAQASIAAGQLAKYSPSADSQISYAVNVPSASAQSGSGDIFIQIKGPISGSNPRSWIAIGQGTGMAGANIFVVYPNSAGNNVTLSPRLGQGHFEPDHNAAAKVELLSGTGIENGIMTANFKCSSCTSWSGGSMSLTDSASDWIWSSAAYGNINSDDTSLDISQHDIYGTFTFDLTAAAGGSSANPFVASSSSGSASGSATAASASSTANAGSSSGSSSGSSEGGGQDFFDKFARITTAHASVMSLAFLFFYPLGAIIMRIGIGAPTLLVHAALQGFAYILAITGMGLGIWMALNTDQLNTPHAIIGLVVVCTLIFQAPFGILHHSNYKKQGRRTAVSFMHIWLGRALMTLGAINGGLGLMLADDGNIAGYKAYGIMAGLIYVGYFALIAGTFGKGKRNAARRDAAGTNKVERSGSD